MLAFEYEILIPAFNAGKTLQLLIDQIKDLENKPSLIRVIDDGSSDNTANIAIRNGVQLVSIPEKKGKGHALKTGFSEFLNSGSADYVVCIDSDLQHPVTSIVDFLDAATKEKHKIIIGRRDWNMKNMPLLRIISNFISSKILSNKTGRLIADSQCGFRMIHRNVLDNVSMDENGFQMETEFILKAANAGYDFHFELIPTIYNGSISNIKHINDTFRFLKIIRNN